MIKQIKGLNEKNSFFFLFTFLSCQKCQCCLDGSGGNQGCGSKGPSPAPICTAYGTNPAGTGIGTCAFYGGGEYDSFVRIFIHQLT